MYSGKVMFISDHGDPLAELGGIQSGGQNVYVRELVQALDFMGIEADVFTHWSDPDRPQIEPLGRKSRVIRLAAGRKGFCSKHKMFGMLPRFIKELKQFAGKNLRQYAVIHSNYWLSGCVGLQMQNSLHIPRVHTSHSLGIVKKNALDKGISEPLTLRLRVERELLQRANRVIATTPLEKDVLAGFYSVLPENLSVVPCGVNTGLFRPLNSKPGPGRSAAPKKTVLFVGRFEKNKGIEILLKSFAILKDEHPATASCSRLLIAGGDPLDVSPEALSCEKKKYLEFIRESGISDLVAFAGPLKHEVLPAYYSEACVTVMPSHYESFGLVALEAMACGCPVIASRTGGLQHNVLHGKTGLLVNPQNPVELASAINRLLTNEKTRKKMSMEAALHGKQFSWRKIALNMVNVYKEVIRWQKAYQPKSLNTF
ncbi:MAG: glycosyltransferase [Desulfocucumaceae bacterium]